MGLGDLDITFDRKSACSARFLSGYGCPPYILYLETMKLGTVFQIFKPFF